MAERKRRSTTGTTGSKTKGTARSKTKRTTSKTGTSRKKSGTMSWMKYELWGLVLVVIGALVAAGTAGIDTGNIGLSLDDIFAYAFGTGRMLVALMLVAAGLQYIVKRKALPFTRNWLMGAVVFELLLSLWHVIFTNPGEEFVPPALRAGGGLFGAVPAAFLRSWFGGFGAVLALIVVLIGTVMIWKKVSLSKPVAFAQEVTAEGVSHVSEKAVAGIQTASHSVQESWQRHKERKIFDVEREKDALGEGLAGAATAVNAEGAAEDNGAGIETPSISSSSHVESGYTDNSGGEDDGSFGDEYGTPCDEEDSQGDVPVTDDEDIPVPEEDEVMPKAPGNSIVEHKIVTTDAPGAYTSVPPRDPSLPPVADIKPMEPELTAGTVEVGAKGQTAVPTAVGEKTYRLPSVSILHRGNPPEEGLSDEVRQNAQILQDTLKSFNIDAKMLTASRGPAVTRYELEPAAGVKVSKIVHLADDLALKLAATDIRIEAPIPGKAAVGIEVPNKKVTPVCLRDVLDTDVFQNSVGGVPVALGKDIAGTPIVADLTKMPHMLVAGSTGSGKSVCINTLISSILFKQRPEDVKLILVDPKVVELSNYNGIPHLMTPVVTDPKKAANVLRWAVKEMDDRYKRFALTKTRDIKRYNELNPEEAMPYVVIIIDELADLMMAAAGDVEDSICRLAQKARACGMHLVLATQRPSVDVITGLIKANVPSRIAFAVSSQIDSRTILDMAGAEKLIGKGDMLFYPMGASKPVRVQGAFVSDGEIDELVEYIKEQRRPQYNEAVEAAQQEASHDDGKDDFFEDELMDKAIMMVMETQQASVSLLQRRFRIGFSRAARMIDTMEAMHIVGPSNGSKARDILMTPEEVQEKYFSHS